MKADIRETAEYAAVAEHLRKLHEPAFGRAHALCEPHATGDGARVAVTGVVFDELAGVPRTAIYTCQGGDVQPVSAACGSARRARFAPEESVLAFLSDRGNPGVMWHVRPTAPYQSAVIMTTAPRARIHTRVGPARRPRSDDRRRCGPLPRMQQRVREAADPAHHITSAHTN